MRLLRANEAKDSESDGMMINRWMNPERRTGPQEGEGEWEHKKPYHAHAIEAAAHVHGDLFGQI